jgi:hypothetical protein
MATAFQKANARNAAEIERLEKLIANLESLNTLGENYINWNAIRPPYAGRRLQALKLARKANPGNYNINKLRKNKRAIGTKRTAHHWMYGYVPKLGANWVGKGGRWVPPNLPLNEVEEFHRIGGPRRRLFNSHGKPLVLNKDVKGEPHRTMFTKEGTLKPAVHTARRKPSPAKRPERHLPTLKEFAWAAPSTNENFETVKTMNNKQLKLFSKHAPVNWTMLKPKKRAAPLPVNNLTKYRREAAARVIGKAAKKYLKRKAPQRVKGPSPRSPATLARQANLGIMGGARRSPVRAANNTRITWSRNANGKISIHKTLRNLNLSISPVMKNILANMPENQAMNYIRNLARER